MNLVERTKYFGEVNQSSPSGHTVRGTYPTSIVEDRLRVPSYSCVLRQRHLNEVLNELVIKWISSTVQSMHIQPACVVHLRTLQENHSRVLLLLRPHAVGTIEGISADNRLLASRLGLTRVPACMPWSSSRSCSVSWRTRASTRRSHATQQRQHRCDLHLRSDA